MSISSHRFLLVTDSPDDYGHQALREALSTLGSCQVISEADVVSLLREQAFDVVIVDAGSVTSAPELVSRIRAADFTMEVVVVTLSPHWKIARAVFRAGAADYLPKVLSRAEILANFRSILERRAAAARLDAHGGMQNDTGNDSVC
jgi:DNA-binding NarL/FixJ family response regulator